MAEQQAPEKKEKTIRMFGGTKHSLTGIMYAERFSDRLPAASVSCCVDRPGEEIVMQDTYMAYDKQLFHASSVGEVRPTGYTQPPEISGLRRRIPKRGDL